MSVAWRDDPIAHLIGPTSRDDFFARFYEREALVAAHNDAARFADLVSIDTVDRLITSADLREGQLDMADASRELRRDAYVDEAGFVDRGAVADLYRNGATIILQQAHQFEPALGAFCRALEHVFSSHVQTNLYLTPANAQGFRTHYDNHDVFVLQVSGQKAWRLYGTPIDTPYRGEAFHSGEHQSGAISREFVLKAGDCAYVPRGMMHDASTSGSDPSLHITVGLITRTWADLMLEAVSEVALRSPNLRRSLPAGFASREFDRSAARATLKSLAEELAKELQLDPALDLMADTFIRSRAADNRGAIAEAARPIGANETFRARAYVPFRIAEDTKGVVVIAPGGELMFAPALKEAVERALNGAAFAPQTLNVAEAAEISARLLAYGLIERV